jgi:hypothetical protein
MIAAASFDWVPVLVTTGSLALGSLLTMAGQALSDRRTRARESAARKDQLRIQLYQEERAVLHQLQDLVLEMHLAHTAFASRALELTADDFSRAVGTLLIELTPQHTAKEIALYHRCRTDAVRNAKNEYTEAVNKWLAVESSSAFEEAWGDVQQAFIRFMLVIGEELRRTPLSALVQSNEPRKLLLRKRRLDSNPVDNP